MKHTYLLFLIAFCIACNSSEKKSNSAADSAAIKQSITNDTTQNLLQTEISATAPTLLELNKTILKIIKDKDYAALEAYIHPKMGLHFTPYGMVNIDDVIIGKVNFSNSIKSNDKIIWGHYDGTGEVIELSLKDYFAKFVYDVDFLHAEQVNINKSVASGNSINNIRTAYADSDYVENYFSGFDQELQGLDWRALRLVFKKEGNRRYLIGIVHDQWTT